MGGGGGLKLLKGKAKKHTKMSKIGENMRGAREVFFLKLMKFLSEVFI